MATIMLCPNPHRGMAVDRVVVLGASADQTRVTVFSIDALDKNPTFIRMLGAEATRSVAFQRGASALLFLAGIALSFLWRWWAFIPGIVVAMVVYRSTQLGIADRVLSASKRDPNGFLDRYMPFKVTWVAPASSLVAQ